MCARRAAPRSSRHARHWQTTKRGPPVCGSYCESTVPKHTIALSTAEASTPRDVRAPGYPVVLQARKALAGNEARTQRTEILCTADTGCWHSPAHPVSLSKTWQTVQSAPAVS